MKWLKKRYFIENNYSPLFLNLIWGMVVCPSINVTKALMLGNFISGMKTGLTDF
jgi:hypothetical protein